MNKRRLLKLADLLEADAKNKKGVKFDLAYVGKKIDENGAISAIEHGEILDVSCGTVACAVGLACISGAFKRARLSYEIIYGEITPVFGEFFGWNSAQTKFFDISIRESNFLFLEDHYPCGKTSGATGERFVAKRIRDFVAGKVAP